MVDGLKAPKHDCFIHRMSSCRETLPWRLVDSWRPRRVSGHGAVVWMGCVKRARTKTTSRMQEKNMGRSWDIPWDNIRTVLWDMMGYNGIYPLVN